MEVFLTGSCWNDAFAMAAANKSFEISQTHNVADQVLGIGSYFSSELEKLCAARGIPEDDRTSIDALSFHKW